MSCAFEFSKLGAKVVLVARSENSLKDISLKINQNGGESIFSVVDVSVESDCEKMIEETISKYGKIDILVNNAGISMRSVFLFAREKMRDCDCRARQ